METLGSRLRRSDGSKSIYGKKKTDNIVPKPAEVVAPMPAAPKPIALSEPATI